MQAEQKGLTTVERMKSWGLAPDRRPHLRDATWTCCIGSAIVINISTGRCRHELGHIFCGDACMGVSLPRPRPSCIAHLSASELGGRSIILAFDYRAALHAWTTLCSELSASIPLLLLLDTSTATATATESLRSAKSTCSSRRVLKHRPRGQRARNVMSQNSPCSRPRSVLGWLTVEATPISLKQE